jgi:hypothetical protein
VENSQVVDAGPLSAEQVEEIREGKAWIYAVGQMNYDDVFGESHKTEFCAIYEPRTSTSMIPCSLHNSAD